jgi:hypothetical protein
MYQSVDVVLFSIIGCKRNHLKYNINSSAAIESDMVIRAQGNLGR